MPQPKKPSAFLFVTWTLVAVIAFGLICLPLLQNLWACYHWQPVPCRIVHGGYMLEYQGKTYVAHRLDFWDSYATTTPDPVVNTSNNHFDQTCYVSPGDPPSVVLALDAHKRWGRASKSVILTVFFVAAASILTWNVHRRNKLRTTPAK